LIPNPIRKVLSTMAKHQVRALLMGGQACVFYGAAEFSRDTDLAILAEPENLERLRNALAELEADCIAVPPFEAEFLHRGHAIHFRCQHPEAVGMRVDVMANMRGGAPFPELWERRTVLADAGGIAYELLSLPDLVQAKKTQRDKDWPMLRRLIEADYLAGRGSAEPHRVDFWLKQLRTVELLIEATAAHRLRAEQLAVERPLLQHAITGANDRVEAALADEERTEREADRAYWQPLKAELERLRHGRA
jgi:PHD/YefM family antitoxin component YafN of YafNO toxin-antitoxin module